MSGDPACFLHAVCISCGRFTDAPDARECWACGVESEAFQQGHAETMESPVAHASELLSFDVGLSASMQD